MIPTYEPEGQLPPGQYMATWHEVTTHYGYNPRRRRLLRGLLRALVALRDAGVPRVYLDGSFVTTKRMPNDFDGCWEVPDTGVDEARLEAAGLLSFANGCAAQKALYFGELWLSEMDIAQHGPEDEGTFLPLYQGLIDDDVPKGIVVVELDTLP